MALSRSSNFVAGTKILSAVVNTEFTNYMNYINDTIHKDGSVAMLAAFQMKGANPAIVWDGDGGSAVKWRIREATGALQFQYDSAGWLTFLNFNSASGIMSLSGTGEFHAANCKLEASAPYLEMEGSEVNGEIWRIEEDAGLLYIRYYDSVASLWDISLALDKDVSVGTPRDFKADVFKPYSGGGTMALTGPVRATSTLEVDDSLQLDGTPAISSRKVITSGNRDIDLVDTVTFNATEISSGVSYGDMQRVYKSITGETVLDCMDTIPLLTSVNLTSSDYARATVVSNNMVFSQLYVCLEIHNYVAGVADAATVEVYQWQENPEDHV